MALVEHYMMAVFVLKSMTQSAVCLKSVLKTQISFFPTLAHGVVTNACTFPTHPRKMPCLLLQKHPASPPKPSSFLVLIPIPPHSHPHTPLTPYTHPTNNHHIHPFFNHTLSSKQQTTHNSKTKTDTPSKKGSKRSFLSQYTPSTHSPPLIPYLKISFFPTLADGVVRWTCCSSRILQQYKLAPFGHPQRHPVNAH